MAGAKGRQIFTDAACDMVFRYAGGVPRLINVLCDTAMLCAFAEERDRQRDDDMVKAAAEELQWVEYSERVSARQSSSRQHAPAASQAPARAAREARGAAARSVRQRSSS